MDGVNTSLMFRRGGAIGEMAPAILDRAFPAVRADLAAGFANRPKIAVCKIVIVESSQIPYP
jgi:hypothetical protein